jgi:truncated hemoglobin YjbI
MGLMERQKQEVRIFERSIMSGSASAKSAKSLFDKLGGTKSIEAVVDEFYKRVLADTELKPFFAKTNMTWLRMRQVQFL